MLFSRFALLVVLGALLGSCTPRPVATRPAAGAIRIAEGGLLDRGLAHRWGAVPIVDVAAAGAGCRLVAADGVDPETIAADWSLPGTPRPLGERLEICGVGSARDLGARLSRPELWVLGRGPPQPLVKVDVSDEAAAFARGEVDLAVVEASSAPVAAARRASAWDRHYWLALHPERRWVNDPRLRRFLAATLDRPTMSALIGSGARPCGDWRCTTAELPGPSPRPLGALSEPRLSLAHDADDPVAAALARRIKAELAVVAIRVSLHPGGRFADGHYDLAIVRHVERYDDPLLSFEASARELGPAVAGLDFVEGSRLRDRAARAAARSRMEAAIDERATLTPLLRIEAWMLAAPRLGELVAAPYGAVRRASSS